MRRSVALFVCLLVCLGSVSAVDLKMERGRMEMIMDNVSSEIQRHYYDKNMKGLDWKAKTEEARAKIKQANDPSEMITAISGLANSLNDSHTFFVPPMRTARLKFGFDALAVGDKVLVTTVRPGGPADKAGLKVGDEIFTVNGFNAKRENFELMMRFLRRLRPVTVMELQVLRQGQGKRFVIEAEQIVRQAVTDATDDDKIRPFILESENDEEFYHYRVDKDGIGYLHIPNFTMDNQEFAIKRMKDAKAVILDLRSNPGGYQDYVLEMIGHFEKDTIKVAEVRERKGPKELKAKPMYPRITAPLFVLIDSRSASAAEIFAHYAQLTHRGVVIGDQSLGRLMSARYLNEHFGVDTMILYGVEVSIGPVIFPNGDDLEGKGVVPDIKCVPSVADVATGRDVCYARAIQDARKALNLSQDEPLIFKAPDRQIDE